MIGFTIATAKKEDYESGFVYEYLFAKSAELTSRGFQQLVEEARRRAAELKIGEETFDRLWLEYKLKVEEEGAYRPSDPLMEDTSVSYETGFWIVSEEGIWEIINVKRPPKFVCGTPMLPLMMYTDDDDGSVRVGVGMLTAGGLKSIIVEQEKLMKSGSLIKSLSSKGALINSNNGSKMARFFTDLLHHNKKTLPRVREIHRLGWTKDGEFVPYTDKVDLIDNPKFRQIASSVRQQGSLKEWLEAVNRCRKASGAFMERPVDGLELRIVLAASFAAPLCELLGMHSFLIHVQGEPSTGKSVAQKIAASVWAFPGEQGDGFVQSCHSTLEGNESLFEFVHHLPVIMDDTQLRPAELQQLIYMIASGAGKQRKTDVRQVSTWCTTVITSGENPVCGGGTAGGAIRRTLSIDVKGKALITDPGYVMNVVGNNYGFAGREFIDSLDEELIAKGKASMEKHRVALMEMGCEARQARIGAIILVADELSESFVFRDGIRLAEEDIAQYLIKADEGSIYEHAREMLDGWIASESARFEDDWSGVRAGYFEYEDVEYSAADDCVASGVWILASAFDSKCTGWKVDPSLFTEWLWRHGYIERRNGRFRIQQRFGAGRPTFIHYYMGVDA